MGAGQPKQDERAIRELEEEISGLEEEILDLQGERRLKRRQLDELRQGGMKAVAAKYETKAKLEAWTKGEPARC
jgi:predicted  nucleic acid-binding Zn-ribbon protein